MYSYRSLNDYLDATANKAFAPAIAGTVEHGFVAKELLEECREEKKELAMGYQDVGSAFPGVRHQWVQITLWYFHLPEAWAGLLFSYYDRLQARFHGATYVSF